MSIIQVQEWTGGFFSGAGSYNVGAGDHDDMLGVFVKPLRIASVTISNAGGYFHDHGSNSGVVSLRIAATGQYVEIFRRLASGNIQFNSLVNLPVPQAFRSSNFDGLRFISDPAVNQGMHDVATFTVNFTLAGSEGPRTTFFVYGSSAYGGGTPVVERGLRPAEIVATAGATATMGMAVAKLPADIVVRASAPTGSDIVLDKSVAASQDLGAAGRSTVTMGQGTRLTSTVYPMQGVGRMVDAPMGLVKVEARAASDGAASITDNRMLVISAADRFTIYQSRPPYEQQDVLMGTKEGPGAEQGLSMVVFAQGGAARVEMGATIFTRARVDARGGGILRLGVSYTVKTTSNGRAGARDNYLSGPIRPTMTSNGRAGGFNYLGTPIRMQAISRGRAGGASRLGGTALMPNTVSRGVAHWSLGERLLYAHVMAGVGRVNNIRLAGTARIAIRPNGVGSMRENAVLLKMVSRGSSVGTEFDKPPFAFVVLAGSRAYRIGYRRGGEFPGSSGFGFAHDNVGVIAYLSTRIGFANNDPSRCHISSYGWTSTPSTLAGRSTFTFPYEMVAFSHAGCRAYDGHAPDTHYVEPNLSNWERHDRGDHFHRSGYTGPEGVRFRQISPAYMSARTDMERRVRDWPSDFWYLSSRVYQRISAMAGKSTVFFRRIDEMDVHGVGGMEPTLGVSFIRLPQATANGVANWSNNYIPDIRLLHTRISGVAGGKAYQAGKVHFGRGLITSRGIGTFFIDPGLMVARSNGVGRMLDIERPDKVNMRWGSGQFFYEYHFPYIAPLLIPNGSNGISRVEIEERSTGVIHHHMDGVASVTDKGLEGVVKGVSSEVCKAGSYDWTEVRKAEPSLGITGVHHPGPPRFSENYFAYHPQGVEAAFPIQPVLIAINGVGKMTAHMRMDYLLKWQNWYGTGSGAKGSLPYTSNDIAYDENGVLRLASGRVGGVGRFWIRPEPALRSVSGGRANIGIRMHPVGRFAHDLRARGIAVMLKWDLGGGVPPLDRYGNMLRYFFVPIPSYGQIWPRKERQHGQPV